MKPFRILSTVVVPIAILLATTVGCVMPCHQRPFKPSGCFDGETGCTSGCAANCAPVMAPLTLPQFPRWQAAKAGIAGLLLPSEDEGEIPDDSPPPHPKFHPVPTHPVFYPNSPSPL